MHMHAVLADTHVMNFVHVYITNLLVMILGPGLVSISPAQISSMAKYAEGLTWD